MIFRSHISNLSFSLFISALSLSISAFSSAILRSLSSYFFFHSASCPSYSDWMLSISLLYKFNLSSLLLIGYSVYLLMLTLIEVVDPVLPTWKSHPLTSLMYFSSTVFSSLSSLNPAPSNVSSSREDSLLGRVFLAVGVGFFPSMVDILEVEQTSGLWSPLRSTNCLSEILKTLK